MPVSFLRKCRFSSKYSKEPGFKGECVHDDCMYRTKDPYVPCW